MAFPWCSCGIKTQKPIQKQAAKSSLRPEKIDVILFSNSFSNWFPCGMICKLTYHICVRCAYEKGKQAICHLLPQVQVYRQGWEHRKPDWAVPSVYCSPLQPGVSGRGAGLWGWYCYNGTKSKPGTNGRRLSPIFLFISTFFSKWGWTCLTTEKRCPVSILMPDAASVYGGT